MAFWGKSSKSKEDYSEPEQTDPDDLIFGMTHIYIEAIENGRDPDFHATVFLATALVLSSVREIVSPLTWMDRILSIPEPSDNEVEQAKVEAEKINRQLLEKGIISDRVFRNIRQLTQGHIERFRALEESHDDMQMFGRAEKAQYTSTIRMREAIEAAAFFRKTASEVVVDDEGNYSGEQFEVMCPHENQELQLTIYFMLHTASLRYMRLLWLEHEVCGDYSEDINRAQLLGPGWSAHVMGLLLCCRPTFESVVSELHQALGGEILVTPN